MATPVNPDALDTLFRNARTLRSWKPQPVSDELLHQIWDLAKLGPTSGNSLPQRFVFVKSPAAKEKLKPCLEPGNVDKSMSAPVTVIVAYDMRFYELMPKISPNAAKTFAQLASGPNGAEFLNEHNLRNGSLGGAYLMLAARALGLDCGPMSGFNKEKTDATFFPDGRWKSNFLCNIGYGDATGLRPRQARLDFEEACRIE